MSKKDRTQASPIRSKRSKESKELQNLIEIVVSNVLQEKGYQSKRQMEVFCEKIITKSLMDLTKQISTLETSMSSRLLAHEMSVSNLRKHIDDLQSINAEKYMLLQQDLAKMVNANTEQAEESKKSSSTLIKKVYKKQKDDIVHLNSKLGEIKSELHLTSSTLADDVKVQSRELSKLRDLVDEL